MKDEEIKTKNGINPIDRDIIHNHPFSVDSLANSDIGRVVKNKHKFDNCLSLNDGRHLDKSENMVAPVVQDTPEMDAIEVEVNKGNKGNKEIEGNKEIVGNKGNKGNKEIEGDNDNTLTLLIIVLIVGIIIYFINNSQND